MISIFSIRRKLYYKNTKKQAYKDDRALFSI